MKLECSGCSTRYTIDDAIIPPQGAKIRCRKCGAVIDVPAKGAAPRVEPAPTATPVVPASPPPPPVSYTAPSPRPAAPPSHAPAAAPATHGESGAFSFVSGNGGEAATGFERTAPPAAAPAMSAPQAPAPTPSPHAAPAPASPAPAPAVAAPIPEGLPPEEKARHEKARRLARVLASDIAIYNREKKDRGLAEGNLVAVLGYEIKKSWEIYKERVGADFANATPYFRDALNDLLAEGKKIF
jgi:predicted Zn finger-like uncharacterized protein